MTPSDEDISPAEALALKEPPVGTILPLWLPYPAERSTDPDSILRWLYRQVPANWAICGDDQPINGDHKPRKYRKENVDPRFWGQVPPNLNGLFLRGARPITVAEPRIQGQDILLDLRTRQTPSDPPFYPSYCHIPEDWVPVNPVPADLGDHSHSAALPSQTGLITNTPIPKAEGQTPYRTWDSDDKGAEGSVDSHLRADRDDDSERIEGQHHHILGGQVSTSAERDGRHSHLLPGLPTVPRFREVWYIIRIN